MNSERVLQNVERNGEESLPRGELTDPANCKQAQID